MGCWPVNRVHAVGRSVGASRARSAKAGFWHGFHGASMAAELPCLRWPTGASMRFAGRRVHFRRCVPSHLWPVATAKRSELPCQRYRSFAASMGCWPVTASMP